MIIPIPSAKNSFIIKLTIEAHMPFELAIRVYDPRYANTFYFKRKARFKRGKIKREFSIALPVSPEVLEMELYDKNSSNDYAFKVASFNIEKLEKPAIWATDEQHRFMEFAISFSQKAGYISPGFYDSGQQEFLFQYLSKITDGFGNELITPARINRKMPRVQISRSLFLGYTIPVRIAILAHEGCHWFLNTRSQKTADLCGIKQYLDYGFPRIEAVYAVTKIFGKNPEMVNATQVQRTKDVIDFIERYSANE